MLTRLSTWEPLTRPDELRGIVPATTDSAHTTQHGRSAIRRILTGADNRLLVIVGPCSLQDQESSLDYAGRLMALAEQLSDDLFVVMRAYVE